METLRCTTNPTDLAGLLAKIPAGAEVRGVFRMGVASNVVVDGLEPYLQKHALLAGYRGKLVSGSYNDFIGSARAFTEAGCDAVLLIPFFDNLVPFAEAGLASASSRWISERSATLAEELRLAIEGTPSVRRTFVGLPHRFERPSASGWWREVDAAVDEVAASLRERLAGVPGLSWLDLERVVERVGHGRALTRRGYARFKAPYTAEFWDELMRQISALSRSFGTEYRKVLVVDCDNTLWGGVVGEDGLGGIKLDPHAFPGRAYWYAQQRILKLQSRGVMLCICSKNNPADVEEVFATHPHSLIRSEHLVSREVGWGDKPSALRRMAERLGVGLASFVFLDDSTQECDAVRQQCPEVLVVQAPMQVSDYADVLDAIDDAFAANEPDDGVKLEQYRQREAANADLGRYASHDEYLESLQMRVEVRVNDRPQVGRISELTQKTNQFNLTTRRYTEAEIAGMMEGTDFDVYTGVAEDRFGGAGLILVIVVAYESEVARVDICLMSCRVIGRGIEFAPWRLIGQRCRNRGYQRIIAEYRPTAKNSLVRDFFEAVGLEPEVTAEGCKRYSGKVERLLAVESPHLEVAHVF
jgi:FkbH-like protein